MDRFRLEALAATDITSASIERPNSTKLMAVLDEINQSGLGRVFLARQGMHSAWGMKRDHLSPAYTTRWTDLPTVR